LANVRLLIVEPDLNFRADFRKQLQGAAVEIVGEAEYGADAVSLVHATKPDAVAISWQDPAVRAEQTIESLSRSLPSTPLIVYSDSQDLASVRRAVQAGAHDFLSKPIDTREFVKSLDKAFARMERQRQGETGAVPISRNGTVISLFGAKGGIGKTTLATNLAVSLAQLRHESVALMDIDTRFGDVAIVLNLQPHNNIAETVPTIDELDRNTIKTYLTPHPSGISVLTAPTRPSEWRQVQPVHVERLINLLEETHDYVVLDTPGFFTELVGTALDMSDLVLLVTTLDVSSIKDCAMAVDMLSHADFPMSRVKLVINHTNDFHKVDPKQITDVTGLDIFWSVPFDKSILRGGQVGMPLVMTNPDSKGAQSMIDLALAISGGKREKRLFGRRKIIFGKMETLTPATQGGAVNE
jgi:pilus assembly protein CpaE